MDPRISLLEMGAMQVNLNTRRRGHTDSSNSIGETPRLKFRPHWIPDRMALERYRFRTSMDPIGAMMASYGHQHLLPEHLLRRKGMMTQTIRPGKGTSARYYTPWEWAAALVLPSSTTLPADNQEAYHPLGNIICPVQGLIAIQRTRIILADAGISNGKNTHTGAETISHMMRTGLKLGNGGERSQGSFGIFRAD